MPSYSGVWTLTAQYQAIGGQNWPMAPGAPTSVSATAGDASATVAFVAPTFVGIPPPITGYLATSTPGGFTATGASSPLTVTGLSNGTAYTFGVQATNAVGYGPAGTSGSVSPAAPIAVIFGGRNSSNALTNTIQYYSMSSTGDASDFGDLSIASIHDAAGASSTRAVTFLGSNASFGNTNVIEYITFSTTGNATDFGDATITSSYNGGCSSNSTRAVNMGGYVSGPTNINVMSYVTIASAGNAIDFGDTVNGAATCDASGSPTRGVFTRGLSSVEAGTRTNSIQYITIASTGNATAFGDLSLVTEGATGSGSSSTRALMWASNGSNNQTTQYITIASTGNATNFGDLSIVRAYTAMASNSTIVTVNGGENTSSVKVNVIQYFTLAATGSSTDFGDLIAGAGFERVNGTSSAHGGLQ